MSFHIDWAAVTDPRLVSKVTSWMERMIDEKVNATLTDGTQIHLLELHPGSEPPSIELASMGMDRTDPVTGGSGSGGVGDTTTSSVQQYAVPADQLVSESSILGQGSNGPRTPGTAGSSGRGSPRGMGNGWEGASTPGLIGSPSPSPSLLSSSFSSMASSRVGGIASRCGTCGGRLAPPTSMPAFNLSGRLRYSSDFYVTLQVRRQVNPYVSTRGLHGRLARGHLPAGTMDWPMTVELWVRLGELRIEGQVDAEYTPPIKAAATNTGAAAAGSNTQSSSALQSPAHTRHHPHQHSAHHSHHSHSQLHSQLHSRSATPVHHHAHHYSSHHNQNASASRGGGNGGTTAAGGSFLLVPPAFPSNSASASPALPTHSYTPGLSSSSSFSTPSLSGSPAFGAPAQCQCAANASMLAASVERLSASSGAAAAPAAATAASPATVTILLDANPLQGYRLTSVLDGSPAGRKLVRLADSAVQKVLSALVGQKVTFELPDFSFAELKKKAAEAAAKKKSKRAHAQHKDASAVASAAGETKSHE